MDRNDDDRSELMFSLVIGKREESITDSGSPLTTLSTESVQSGTDSEDAGDTDSDGDESDSGSEYSEDSKAKIPQSTGNRIDSKGEKTTKERGRRLHGIPAPGVRAETTRKARPKRGRIAKTKFCKPNRTKRNKPRSKVALKHRRKQLNKMKRESKDRERSLRKRIHEQQDNQSIPEDKIRSMAIHFQTAQRKHHQPYEERRS